MKTFSQIQSWFLPCFAVVLSLFLLAFQGWLQLVDIPDWEEQLLVEQNAVQQLKDDQTALMDADLRTFLQHYSQQVESLEVVLDVRDQVFNHEEGSRLDPVVVLPVLEFFQEFQERLLAEVLLNNVSLNDAGEVSFLIKTTSYQQAADQIEALRFDLQETSLFVDVEVGSVVQAPIAIAQQENLPDFLSGQDASFDALIRLQINPDFMWSSQVSEDEGSQDIS